MDEESRFKLEQMIDKYTVAQLLVDLGGICQDKAEHCAVSWQDTTMAKRWVAQAASVLVCARGAQERGL